MAVFHLGHVFLCRTLYLIHCYVFNLSPRMSAGICPSVRPSHSCIVSKRIKILSFFLTSYPRHSSFQPKHMYTTPMEIPAKKSTISSGWVRTIRNFRPISSYILETRNCGQKLREIEQSAEMFVRTTSYR